MSDKVVTGKGILHEIEQLEYKSIKKEDIEKELKKLLLSAKPKKKMSIMVGKGFLKEVYENHGGKQGLINFLEDCEVMTGAEGMEYLREVVPEIFKHKENEV